MHVEVAGSYWTRLRGLLGRSGLQPGEGLLLRPASSVHTAFMRFAIDVVFLDRELRVLEVVEAVPPWRLKSRRGARAVLELGAGEAARQGIAAGERLRSPLVTGSNTSGMGGARTAGRGAPGRARTPRAEREEQMIEAASRLFAQRGFDGSSMDDIAKASGITKPMLYAYFDSKEGLFAACAQRAGAKLRDDLRGVGQREDLSPDKQLWEGLQRVFAFVDEHHDSWLLLYPEGAPAPGSIGSGAVAARDAMASLLTELFTRAARDQGLSDEALAHVEAIAHSFTAATIGAASHWAKQGDEPRDVAALRLMNLLWMGCGSLLDGRLWLPK